MRCAWGFVLVGSVALAAACDTEGTADDGGGGLGGSGGGGAGGGGCTLDTFGSAGAVAITTVVPPAGSWCPADGLEVCTAPSTALPPVGLPDAGRSDSPVQSRCVGNAWVNDEVEACEPASHPGCNIPARFTDGACCTAVRYCFEAFCDGERWWTNGER